jgi:heme a synthase
VLGALVRHMGAGLAIPDFPLAFGRLVPPLETAGVAVHFAHRLWALVVTGFVLAAAVRLGRTPRAGLELRALATALLVLLATQLTLGAYTIWTQRAVLPTTLHVVTGAALLACCVLAAMRSYQKLGLSRADARAPGKEPSR